MLNEFTLDESPFFFSPHLVCRRQTLLYKTVDCGFSLAKEFLQASARPMNFVLDFWFTSLGGELSAKLPHLIGQFPYEIDQRWHCTPQFIECNGVVKHKCWRTHLYEFASKVRKCSNGGIKHGIRAFPPSFHHITTVHHNHTHQPPLKWNRGIIRS